MNLFNKLFSFSGSYNRLEYLLAIFIIPVIICLISGIFGNLLTIHELKIIITIVGFCFCSYIFFAAIVKRYHDLGKSGDTLLWWLIPGYGIFALVALFFMKGNRNQYSSKEEINNIKRN